MKPIIVRNSRIPKLVSWFFPVAAITLWPFVFIRTDHDSPRLINHEEIHIRQYNEMLVIGFLLVYIYDWVVGLLKHRNAHVAYRLIRFEQEAFEYDSDPDYHSKRKRFSWKKYVI